MHSFNDLVTGFAEKFNISHFPGNPTTLYEPCDYFLALGGKRVRPVMCLMGNELFDEIKADAYEVAIAIELFHNFTLVHDDIMDAAPLRRGMETVHKKYGDSVALLSGDIMLIKAYEYINKIHVDYLRQISNLFTRTAKEVCEGQQLDMDFEKQETVSLDDYLHMISLKTSVLLAASLEMGAIIGGASGGNCRHIYQFGLNLGIAFQIQDDYLDAFGDPEKFGKDVGGDIRQNKKTILLLRALEAASAEQKAALLHLMHTNPADKVEKVLDIFRSCKVDVWANELKAKYVAVAYKHLEDVAVTVIRKKPLEELVAFLISREY